MRFGPGRTGVEQQSPARPHLGRHPDRVPLISVVRCRGARVAVQARIMSRPRQVLPGHFYLLTRRCTRGRAVPGRQHARNQGLVSARRGCSSTYAMLTSVKALKAHVQNGQIVLDEPADLPEGVAVEVLLPENDELTVVERAELEAALEESAAQFARGEFEDAHAFARRLFAKS